VRSRQRDWHKTRSTHASVLESLEQVISRHPANGVVPRDGVVPGDSARVAPSAPVDDGDAVVLAFRPRLALVPDGNTPGAA
jgi:hypothetical protein